jgi:hypothetical protein
MKSGGRSDGEKQRKENVHSEQPKSDRLQWDAEASGAVEDANSD